VNLPAALRRLTGAVRPGGPVVVTLDPTGALVVGGKKLFPIGLSLGPPQDGKAPNGRNALAEVAGAGVSFVRGGRDDWSRGALQEQLATEGALLDALASHGLHDWLWLGGLPNLPASGSSPNETLLTSIVNELKEHPALLAWKGVDEPAHAHVAPAGLVHARQRLHALDPSHPLVITQAPVGTEAELLPYRAAFDITGADVYPVSYPPGTHAGTSNHDISVVGDVTKKMVAAAGGKPVWMTLQIAWSGVTPTKERPEIVPRFPSLHDERFMAYQAIANGARGLVFFGGHLTEIASPADAKAGWNWTFWNETLRPVVAELSSASVAPALVAPAAAPSMRASAADVEHVARDDGRFLYVVAVRRDAAQTSEVELTGLPDKRDGTPIRGGQVLFEYAQEPPPPPIEPGHQQFRPVAVSGGAFRDWFGPHDAHVYRFAL